MHRFEPGMWDRHADKRTNLFILFVFIYLIIKQQGTEARYIAGKYIYSITRMSSAYTQPRYKIVTKNEYTAKNSQYG